MDESPILVEQRDGYHVLTLNRPQRLNAFTELMHVAPREAINAIS
jgi:2-(1,2-epoxy-1,2-dihydrophenyl)acetyl-CoA isomerase